MKFGKIGTPFYLLRSKEFEDTFLLGEHRRMYERELEQMKNVRKLMEARPEIRKCYENILDKLGNNAQILLLEIGMIEERIREATL